MCMLRFQISLMGVQQSPLTASFDDSCAALEKLTRLFIEPDGSFVWRGSDVDGRDWQVDGNLIDRGDVLAYVDLSGQCPEERLNDLLRAFGWPDAPLAFELPRRGQTLDEPTFRQLARTAAGAI